MNYGGKTGYAALQDAEREECHTPENLTNVRHKSPFQHLSPILQLITFLITAVLLFISLFQPAISPKGSWADIPEGMNRINPTIPRTPKPCGTDAATARANGCVFNLLTMAWLPPTCVDTDLSAEFLEVASEPFFEDEAGTRQLADYEKLSERTELTWTTRRYHIMHCVFAWRMLHRGLERGTLLESGVASYHHTEHCADQLQRTNFTMDTIMTKINIDFPDC